MRNSFKFLATTLVVVFVVCALSIATFAASTPFSDVDDRNDKLSDSVALLSHLGVTKGTSETTFGTIDGVTRQQMAAFIYRLVNAGRSLDDTAINSTPYVDLVDRTYFGYISWADTMGVIKGTSETTFNPKGGIILQDAYTMLVRALGHEDETYVYPFTYVSKAKELGLDEGIDSKLTEESILTRGDVAILLYNTFFAELDKEEVKQVERKIGNGTKWVLEKKTYHPTLAEDKYGVEYGEFSVRATTKYAFNDGPDAMDYVPLVEEYDVDMLQLVAVEADEPLKEFVCEFEGTGLDGLVDDYIMQSVQVYYTYKTENGKNKLDEIYFISHAEKTFETSSLGVSYVNTDTDEGYFPGTDHAKCTGKVTAGSEAIYFFDAPYDYLKPNYNSIKTEGMTKKEIDDARYELRNEKNVKLVNLKCLDFEKGTYTYYVDTVNQPTSDPLEIIDTLKRVYSNGVYRMKFFDVDGDDIYEYAYYMPATYGYMDGDDSKFFSSVMTMNAPYKKSVSGSELDLDFKPVIYYNDAVVSGKKFEDGDFVLAFLNPEANQIEVFSVLNSYKGYVDLARPTHGQVRIDGTTFSTTIAYRAVEYLDDGNHFSAYHSSSWDYKWHKFSSSTTFPSLTGQNSVGEVFEIYYLPLEGLNTVLYYDHLEDATTTFGSSELLIPVGQDENYRLTMTKSEFNTAISDNTYYARVYIGGTVKYVPINVDEMDPKLDEGYKNGEYNLYNVEGQDGESAYVEKISKYIKNSDGTYTIVPLLHAEDDGKYVGINRDSTTLVEDDNREQYGNDLGEAYRGIINKVAGTRFELISAESGETLLGDMTGERGGVRLKYFTMKPNTRIIIKNWTDKDEFEFEYLEFDATSFVGSIESELEHIQYILKGDPDSKNCADLVLLYAETEKFKFKNKTANDDGWRIVSGSELVKVKEEEYRYNYTLINPYKGTVETAYGEDVSKKASGLENPVANGTMIKVKSTYVDEKADILTVIDTSDNAGLAWITEYNAEEGYISIVPTEATEDVDCKIEFNDIVESFTYEGAELNFDGEEFKTKIDSDDAPVYGTGLYYEVDENTVVSVLTNNEPGIEAIENGEYKLADLDAIAGQSKQYKCYNDMVLDRKENYGTEYAPYVKAYVFAEEAQNSDRLPYAKYIVIVVNGEEDMIFTDNDPDFLPKSECDNH